MTWLPPDCATPTWLTDALASYPRYACESASSDPADVQVGDMWVVAAVDQDDSLRRVVLVVGTGAATLDVVLVSTELDLASEVDVLLSRTITSAPYDVMAETLVHGRIWWNQVRERIGFIRDDLVDLLLDFIWEERPDELEDMRGAVPRSAFDRVEFEKSELADFHRLTTTSDAPAPAAAIDVSLLTDGALPEHDSHEFLEALRKPTTRFCAGLGDLPAFGERPTIAAIVGPDVASRLSELAAQQLLSGAAAEPVRFSLYGSAEQCEFIAADIESSPFLRLIGAVTHETDAPLGFVGRTPVLGKLVR